MAELKRRKGVKVCLLSRSSVMGCDCDGNDEMLMMINPHPHTTTTPRIRKDNVIVAHIGKVSASRYPSLSMHHMVEIQPLSTKRSQSFSYISQLQYIEEEKCNREEAICIESDKEKADSTEENVDPPPIWIVVQDDIFRVFKDNQPSGKKSLDSHQNVEAWAFPLDPNETLNVSQALAPGIAENLSREERSVVVQLYAFQQESPRALLLMGNLPNVLQTTLCGAWIKRKCDCLTLLSAVDFPEWQRAALLRMQVQENPANPEEGSPSVPVEGNQVSLLTWETLEKRMKHPKDPSGKAVLEKATSQSTEKTTGGWIPGHHILPQVDVEFARHQEQMRLLLETVYASPFVNISALPWHEWPQRLVSVISPSEVQACTVRACASLWSRFQNTPKTRGLFLLSGPEPPVACLSAISAYFVKPLRIVTLSALRALAASRRRKIFGSASIESLWCVVARTLPSRAALRWLQDISHQELASPMILCTATAPASGALSSEFRSFFFDTVFASYPILNNRCAVLQQAFQTLGSGSQISDAWLSKAGEKLVVLNTTRALQRCAVLTWQLMTSSACATQVSHGPDSLRKGAVAQSTVLSQKGEASDLESSFFQALMKSFILVSPCAPSLGVGKSYFDRGEPTEPRYGWEDVGGAQRIRQLLDQHIGWRIYEPERCRALGLDLGGGVLLSGSSGIGKTLCAEAFANSLLSQVRFVRVHGPELLSPFLGGTEKNLRNLFAEARRKKPVLIFIDELDALCGRRVGGGNDEGTESSSNRRVLGQLLTELDGVQGGEGIFLLGCTNRVEGIDPALKRRGRFGVHLEMKVPDQVEREDILKVCCRHAPLHADVCFSKLVQTWQGLHGADIAGIVQNAAFSALGDRRGEIMEKDFVKASQQALQNMKLLSSSQVESLAHQFEM